MDVHEIMTAPVHSLTPEDTLNCAAKAMRDQGIGCVPIVDEQGAAVGVLTDRDIALAAYEVGEALWRMRIAEHMHSPVYTCGPNDGVDVAARLMRKHRVHRLPVVEAGRVIGMISIDDLAFASRQPILEPEPGLTADEVDDTYHSVSGRSKHQRQERHS